MSKISIQSITNYFKSIFSQNADLLKNKTIVSGNTTKKIFHQISPSIVDQIYNSFLKRPSDDIGKNHYINIINESGEIGQVLNAFINSPEFKSKLGLSRLFLPLSIHQGVNEYLANEVQLRAISDKIKTSWEHLGKTRAHHSVITNELFLPDDLNKNISVFWKSGFEELVVIKKQLERFGKILNKELVSVEYGCGVGRVTAPLAQQVSSLHAYDISAPHLEYAEDHMKDEAVDNIVFHLVSDPLAPLHKCDFFYSRIVFQHNPPPIIHQLFKNALVALNPGGVAIIQVPTHINGYSFSIEEWLGKDHLLDMQMHCIPQEAIFKLIDEMGCSLLEVREDNSCGDPLYYLSNTFVITKSK